MKITRRNGNGQSQCRRCAEKGKWNVCWDSWFYNIEGYEGAYCRECVKEIEKEQSNEET